MKATLGAIRVKKGFFIVLFLGLIAASLLVNVLVLSVVTGKFPSSFLLNDGSFFADPESLGDPLDQYLDRVIPNYNKPFAAIMFPRQLTITNEFGYEETLITLQPLFLTPHYFADFAPFALLISIYVVVTRYYSGIKACSRGKIKAKDGVATSLSGAGVVLAPSASSGASTALTALASSVCCGAFAVETSVYFLGFAISAAGFILLSRVFLLAMAGFLIFGILRTARKITHTTLPRDDVGRLD